MDNLIESFGNLKSRLIFLSDGATWIKNWIEDAFPQAITILDYYHACEHLHQFSTSFFKNKKMEQKWTTRQKELLLKSKVQKVIKNIQVLATTNSSAEAENFIAYYQANPSRMDH